MNNRKIVTLLIVLLIGNVSHLFSQVKMVESVQITVSDMDRSVKFYTEMLKCQIISDTEVFGTEVENLYGLFGARLRMVRLKLGDEYLDLLDYLTAGGRSIPEDARSNDLIFQHIAIVVSNMDSAYQWLHAHHVQQVSTAPQTLPASIPEAAGVKAFYFQDPDRHNLELIYFPPDKGQAKWHQPASKLFLGIDHTAIGVGHSGRSHLFYQQLLGFEKKGESWNHGREQEHLNNIENASLHISGYRSMSGPGVEFLEYLKPGPGKLFPADTRSDDLWNWYTVLIVDKADTLFQQCRQAGVHLVSNAVVTYRPERSPAFKGFIIRDADGHAILIKQLL